MILVTVGTQAPFDRMVAAVDRWAGERGRTDVFAQIGASELQPENIEWAHEMSPADFAERMESAEAIVSHAGMGTIIGALELQKPILVMPRRADLGEQRNDHQLASARRFSELGVVHVAMDEEELARMLDGLSELRSRSQIGPHASGGLVERLNAFLDEHLS